MSRPTVRALGYVVWRTRSPHELGRFLAQGIGLQPVDDPAGATTPATAYRMDARACRWLVLSGQTDGLQALGFEVADPDALRMLGERLAAGGLRVGAGSDADCALRAVDALLRVEDPAGHIVEFFSTAREVPDPFVSPTGSAFVTGPLGVGHLVLSTAVLPASLHWYVEELSLRTSDVMQLHGADVAFLRCNPRHHSIALVGLPGASRVLHAMVEMTTLDAVGHAQDRLAQLGFTLRRTLGRHSNDHMVSFYVDGPAALQMEVGWGGRLVDEATWSVNRISTTSLWGHRELPGAQVA